MNRLEKSTIIKTSLRKGFRDGSSKMARRRCYGYIIAPDGRLVIDPTEAEIVRWIFQRYLDGDSLGKIAAGLEKQRILSPTGKLKWNREAIDKLLSNEKYTGRVLLQKTISTGTSQIENNGLMDQYLYTGSHEAMSAYGNRPLPPISLRNERKASTTMLPSPMPQKSWCALSTLWRDLVRPSEADLIPVAHILIQSAA